MTLRTRELNLFNGREVSSLDVQEDVLFGEITQQAQKRSRERENIKMWKGGRVKKLLQSTKSAVFTQNLKT